VQHDTLDTQGNLPLDTLAETTADASVDTTPDTLPDNHTDTCQPECGATTLAKWRLEPLVTIGTGQEGSDPALFRYPSGIDVDSLDNLYVLDTHNSRIQKFTSEGVFIKEWSHEVFSTTEVGTAQGLALDHADRVYAISPKTHVITKYDSEGSSLFEFEMAEHDDWSSGHSHGLGIDSSNHLYVTERVLGQIQVYSEDGSLLDVWSYPVGNGNWPAPPPVWAQGPGGVAIGPDDHVYATDNYWVREFDSSGTLATTWTNPAEPLPTDPQGIPGAFWYTELGVHVDPEGNLLVAESAAGETGRLVAVSPDGSLKWTCGGMKSPSYGLGILPAPNEFILPIDVVVDSQGAVWVSDLWGHYVRKFAVKQIED